jgi:predicted MFS family arabinose efflux permease
VTVAARSSAQPSYGWVVVAALSVTETISWGIVYYGFPVFLRAMEQEFHASRVAVTGAFSVGLAVSAAAALPVGRWLDRQGPRVLMTLGSCLATALLLAWSRIGSLAGLYAVWCGLGLAMAATLYEPAFAAVVQWFTRHRDRALLTVTLAGALASTIFMPLEAWLLDRLGWRGALVALAGMLSVTIPIHGIVLRRPPRLAARGAGDDPAPEVEGITLRGALGTAIFWVLGGAFVIGNFATVSITVHVIPFLTGLGYPNTVAAAAIGWMGAMQVLGRLLFVPIVAWLGPRAIMASIFLAQAGGMALLASVARLPGLSPVIVILGAANGMATLARATAIADVFGRRHYGGISGALALGANGARALGPVGAAVLLTALGSYERVFWAFAGGLVLAGMAVFMTESGGATAAAPDAPPPADSK